MTTTQKDPTPADVLACPMAKPNDADAETVGDYLIKLLTTVWDEQDDFSGKRPFGNSDWTADLYLALVQAGMVDGEIDPEGPWLNNVREVDADVLIRAAIKALLPGKTDPPIADAEVLGVEQEWEIRLSTPDSSGSFPTKTVTATEPWVSGDGHLEMHSASHAVVAIFHRNEWTSVQRTSSPEDRA